MTSGEKSIPVQCLGLMRHFSISRFPVQTGQYDEHCGFPNHEFVRVLRSGGVMRILCPDLLGAGHMSSHRVGFSEGTGRKKLSKRRYWDAPATGYDNKIRIPLQAFRLRAKARKRPLFYINLAPTCFTDQFLSDADAVYLIFADEIRSYLLNSISWEPLEDSLVRHSAAPFT